MSAEVPPAKVSPPPERVVRLVREKLVDGTSSALGMTLFEQQPDVVASARRTEALRRMRRPCANCDVEIGPSAPVEPLVFTKTPVTLLLTLLLAASSKPGTDTLVAVCKVMLTGESTITSSTKRSRALNRLAARCR